MNTILEILRALAWIASIGRFALAVADWLEKYKH